MSEQFERLRQLLSCGATSDECLFYECHDDIIIAGGNKLETFKLPIPIKYIKKLNLIYVQDDHIILKKNLNDLTVAEFDDSLLYFKLNENDTMRFNKGRAKAQLKVLLEDGTILISAILKINVVETLDDMFFNNYDPNLNAIQANVNGQDIKLKLFTDIVANVNNIYGCEFIFDSTWDNLSKYALFKDEYNNSLYVELLNDRCNLPKEVLTGPGNIYIGIIGFESGAPKRSTTWSNSFRVLKSCNNDIEINLNTKNLNLSNNDNLDKNNNSSSKDLNNKSSNDTIPNKDKPTKKISSDKQDDVNLKDVVQKILDNNNVKLTIEKEQQKFENLINNLINTDTSKGGESFVNIEPQGPPTDVDTYKKVIKVDDNQFIDKDYSYTRDINEVKENETNIITISLTSLDGDEDLFSFDLNSKGEF